MNVASLSMSFSTGRMAAEMSVSLLSKALDVAEVTGDALTQMMEEVPVVSGLGEFLDLRA